MLFAKARKALGLITRMYNILPETRTSVMTVQHWCVSTENMVTLLWEG